MVKIKYKCSECIKYSVCKHVYDYEYDCTHLPDRVYNVTTVVQISCSEFVESVKTPKEEEK